MKYNNTFNSMPTYGEIEKIKELHQNQPPKQMSEEKQKAEQIVEKKNPFTLTYFKAGWSETRIKNNNTKYWEWEIKHNGFTFPLSNPRKNTK